MKLRLLTLIGLLVWWSTAAAAATREYRVAHIREGNSNMVIVVSSGFFSGTDAQKQSWYSAIGECARSAGLAGQTLVVGSPNGGWYYWGPSDWQPFLRKINMSWVNARVNKSLTCSF